MEKCPIIVVEETVSPKTGPFQKNESNLPSDPKADALPSLLETRRSETKSHEPKSQSQNRILERSTRDCKYHPAPGTKALSIKLRELRRSSNYSQSVDLRRSSHILQISGSRRSSQCAELQRSRRLHYAQSMGSRKSAQYRQSPASASRRSSHHPKLLESRRGSNISDTSSNLLKRETHHIGSNIRTRRNTLVPPPKLKKKETADKKCRSAPVLPVAGALLIASCLGSPVMFAAGLKLGMFAATKKNFIWFSSLIWEIN